MGKIGTKTVNIGMKKEKVSSKTEKILAIKLHLKYNEIKYNTIRKKTIAY